MKVALLVAFTVAAASATHHGYNPLGFYPREFRGEPFSYGYGMKPYYEPGLGYEGIQYKSAILPGMNSFEVPEYILRSYLPENQVEPILKAYLPETVYRTNMPFNDQIQQPFYQVPEAVAKTYLPKEVYGTYIPTQIQVGEGREHQVYLPENQVEHGAFKSILPTTVALDEHMTFGAGYNGLGHGLQGNQFRNMYGGLTSRSRPLVDTPIVGIPIIQ